MANEYILKPMLLDETYRSGNQALLNIYETTNQSLVEVIENITKAKESAEHIDHVAEQLVNVYNNVAEMKQSTRLKAGMAAKTLGYYSANDGGGAYYVIREKVDGDVDDGGSIHELASGLVAELIIENGTVNVKQFGAKGDGATDDTVAIQSAIDYSFKHNFPKIIVSNGTFLLTDSLKIGGTFTKPCIVGINPKTTILKYDNFSDVKPAILFTGGSGSDCRAYISDITFIGNTNTRAIQIQETNGFRVINCIFEANAVALYLYNDATGHFAEFNELVNCKIGGNCLTAIEYAKNSDGDVSFHGSGIRGCVINTSAGVTASVVKINQGCLPYNSPMDFTVWHRNGQPLINNLNNKATFYGNIRIEPSSSDKVVVANGSTGLCGHVMSNNQNWSFGNCFICGSSLTLNSDDSWGTLDTNIHYKKEGSFVNEDGNYKITIPILNCSMSEIYLTLTSDNWQYCCKFIAVKRPMANEYSIKDLQVLATYNVSGWGSPTIVNSNGSILVTMPTSAPTTANVRYFVSVEKKLYSI